MASVKYYLDKRSKKQDGTYPLKLTVTHKKPFHISLDISIPKENWIDNKIEGNVNNKNFLNNYIQASYSAVVNYLLIFKLNGKLSNIGPDVLKKRIENLNSSNSDPEQNESKITGADYLFNHLK